MNEGQGSFPFAFSLRNMPLQPAHGFGFGGKHAVGLGGVGSAGDVSNVLAGLVFEIGQHVAAEDQRSLRIVIH